MTIPQSANFAPRLMIITDCQRWTALEIMQRFSEICHSARPGSVVVQLRDRELPLSVRLNLGASLSQLTSDTGQLFVVNDRVDVAVLLLATGVHLPEHGVPPEETRSLLVSKGSKSPWISCAWHQLERVPPESVDACVFSPILSARKGRAALGLLALTQARALLAGHQSLIALGGIDASNAAHCLASGADGVAVMGAVFAGDPSELVRALQIERG